MSDEWLTPPSIIAALGGPDSFDLDPCSPVNRPWPTAKAHFTVQDNGLLRAWTGRVWLNPPYSRPRLARFLARMAGHGCGTALLPATTGTAAFMRHVWDEAAAVLFMAGRLNFFRADGTTKQNAGFPTILCAYGFDDADMLAAASIDGRFVPLRIPRAHLIRAAIGSTWGDALLEWMRQQGRAVSLAEIYRAFAAHPKTKGNRHWRAKLRQQLQRGPFERVDRGQWRFA